MQSSEILAEVALGLVGQGSFDDRMNQALQIMGRHLGVSRAYVFLDRPGGVLTDNTHEWCAQGIEPQREHLQGFAYASVPSWRGLLDQDGRILALDVDELAADIKALLKSQGIKSILVMPLFIRNVMAGFIGFDQCDTGSTWDVEELSVLRTASGIVSTILERDIDRKLIAESEANFKRFFDTIDDLIMVADPEGHLLYTNAAVSRCLGYTSAELMEMSLIEMHPEDRRQEASRIIVEMLRRERDTCPLELARKDGTRLQVETRVWHGTWDGKDCLFGISKDLSEKEAQLQMLAKLFSENPMPMALSNVDDNRFSEVNTAFVEKLGYQKMETIGRTSAELSLFVNTAQRHHLSRQLLQDGWIRNAWVQVRRKDGKILEGLFSGGVIDTQGKKKFLTVMVDITEQVELRDRLDSQRRRLRNIIDSTQLGTWEWNIPTGQTTFNDRWAAMLGYTIAELEPTTIDTWKRLTLPEDLALAETILSKHFSGESEYYEFEGRMRHKEGKLVWVLDRGKVIERDEKGAPLRMFGTHQDITGQKMMEEKIRDLSIRDPLTGIYNRRFIFQRLEELVAEAVCNGRTFCVSMMDLDNFKSLNDRYGHAFGDDVLRSFTGIVGATIQPGDALGRYGGEEFLLISVDAKASQIVSMTKTMIEEVQHKEFYYDGEAVRFGFSCGTAESAEFSRKHLSVENLLALADKRLYEAKKAGRGMVIGPA